MSASREERRERRASYIEYICLALDDAPGGLSKGRLCQLADVPEDSIASLCVELRKNATEIGRTITVLQINGEWIYGWAELLEQHRSEQLKRRKNEARALAITVETLTQSVNEHPRAMDLRRQLVAAQHRLEDVELQMEELTGQLRLIRNRAA